MSLNLSKTKIREFIKSSETDPYTQGSVVFNFTYDATDPTGKSGYEVMSFLADVADSLSNQHANNLSQPEKLIVPAQSALLPLEVSNQKMGIYFASHREEKHKVFSLQRDFNDVTNEIQENEKQAAKEKERQAQEEKQKQIEKKELELQPLKNALEKKLAEIKILMDSLSSSEVDKKLKDSLNNFHQIMCALHNKIIALKLNASESVAELQEVITAAKKFLTDFNVNFDINKIILTDADNKKINGMVVEKKKLVDQKILDEDDKEAVTHKKSLLKKKNELVMQKNALANVPNKLEKLYCKKRIMLEEFLSSLQKDRPHFRELYIEQRSKAAKKENDKKEYLNQMLLGAGKNASKNPVGDLISTIKTANSGKLLTSQEVFVCAEKFSAESIRLENEISAAKNALAKPNLKKDHSSKHERLSLALEILQFNLDKINSIKDKLVERKNKIIKDRCDERQSTFEKEILSCVFHATQLSKEPIGNDAYIQSVIDTANTITNQKLEELITQNPNTAIQHLELNLKSRLYELQIKDTSPLFELQKAITQIKLDKIQQSEDNIKKEEKKLQELTKKRDQLTEKLYQLKIEALQSSMENQEIEIKIKNLETNLENQEIEIKNLETRINEIKHNTGHEKIDLKEVKSALLDSVIQNIIRAAHKQYNRYLKKAIKRDPITAVEDLEKRLNELLEELKSKNESSLVELQKVVTRIKLDKIKQSQTTLQKNQARFDEVTLELNKLLEEEREQENELKKLSEEKLNKLSEEKITLENELNTLIKIEEDVIAQQNKQSASDVQQIESKFAKSLELNNKILEIERKLKGLTVEIESVKNLIEPNKDIKKYLQLYNDLINKYDEEKANEVAELEKRLGIAYAKNSEDPKPNILVSEPKQELAARLKFKYEEVYTANEDENVIAQQRKNENKTPLQIENEKFRKQKIEKCLNEISNLRTSIHNTRNNLGREKIEFNEVKTGFNKEFNALVQKPIAFDAITKEEISRAEDEIRKERHKAKELERDANTKEAEDKTKEEDKKIDPALVKAKAEEIAKAKAKEIAKFAENGIALAYLIAIKEKSHADKNEYYSNIIKYKNDKENLDKEISDCNKNLEISTGLEIALINNKDNLMNGFINVKPVILDQYTEKVTLKCKEDKLIQIDAKNQQAVTDFEKTLQNYQQKHGALIESDKSNKQKGFFSNLFGRRRETSSATKFFTSAKNLCVALFTKAVAALRGTKKPVELPLPEQKAQKNSTTSNKTSVRVIAALNKVENTNFDGLIEERSSQPSSSNEGNIKRKNKPTLVKLPKSNNDFFSDGLNTFNTSQSFFKEESNSNNIELKNNKSSNRNSNHVQNSFIKEEQRKSIKNKFNQKQEDVELNTKTKFEKMSVEEEIPLIPTKKNNKKK